VAPELILRTFQQGPIGVMVLADTGDRHYVSGNHRTAKRLPLYKKLLELPALNRSGCASRVSASEGSVSLMVKEFTETLRAMPPMKGRLKRPSRQSTQANLAPVAKERVG
jgi:coenzyme F420-reducing hydrogenase delta subunit